jgi:large subunit ribosomal protein L15
MIQNLPSPKTTKKAKRVGRGQGSGVGNHTTGRGNKGQKSRSGYTQPRPGFEGGQMPLSRRIPKLRGLNSGRSRKFFTAKQNKYAVTLSQLEQIQAEVITPVAIVEAKIFKITGANPEFKILFDREIGKKVSVENVPMSAKAKASIEKAGGTVK